MPGQFVVRCTGLNRMSTACAVAPGPRVEPLRRDHHLSFRQQRPLDNDRSSSSEACGWAVRCTAVNRTRSVAALRTSQRPPALPALSRANASVRTRSRYSASGSTGLRVEHHGVEHIDRQPRHVVRRPHTEPDPIAPAFSSACARSRSTTVPEMSVPQYSSTSPTIFASNNPEPTPISSTRRGACAAPAPPPRPALLHLLSRIGSPS